MSTTHRAPERRATNSHGARLLVDRLTVGCSTRLTCETPLRGLDSLRHRRGRHPRLKIFAAPLHEGRSGRSLGFVTDKLIKTAKNSFVEAVEEAAKEFPGVGSVLAVLSGISRARTEVKFQTFLEEIGKPLAFGNIEAVVAYIGEKIEEPWMIEGLEEGWKAAQEALDPVAKLCIYTMVADYLSQEKKPDRAHRQLSRLFMASDEKILRMLCQLAESLSDFKETCLIGTSESTDGARFEYTIFQLGGDFVVLDFPMDEYSVEAACEVAVLASLGVHWSDPSIQDERPGFDILHRICQIDPHHHPVWKKLHRYLKAVLGGTRT